MSDERVVVVKTELDCWQEEAPVCPYCGGVEDPGGLDVASEEVALPIDCLTCGEVFYLEIEAKKTYTTSPYEGWQQVRIDKSKKDDPSGGAH